VDQLAGLRRTKLEELLPELSRDELKTACEGLDLGTSGRAKQVLIDRILGAGDGKAMRQSRNQSRTECHSAPDGLAIRPTMLAVQNGNGPLTLQKLESHLWGAADILRGSIDSSGYKHYIFGLLFFKRLCDVWQEEYELRLAEYDDAELAADPDEHRCDIPRGHSWSDVRKHTTNTGEHLNAAFHAIEDANHRLGRSLALPLTGSSITQRC